MLQNINKSDTVGLLSECLNALGSPAPGPISERVRIWQSRGGFLVSILEEGVHAFEDLISLIEHTGRVDGRAISNVYSRKYIEARIQEVIGQLVAAAVERGQTPSDMTVDQILEVLNEWLRGFEIPEEVAEYYTVIGNLAVEAPLQVGSVTLSPLNEDTQEALLTECGRVIDRTLDPEETKERSKQQISDAFRTHANRAIAQATVREAEPQRAQEIFEDRVREVLHTLRFFGYFVYPTSSPAVIDLAGHVHSGWNFFLGLVPESRIKFTGRRVRDPVAYELAGERLEHLNNIGLPLAGAILSRQDDERGPLAKSCINAITWMGRALQDDVADSRFLKMCIAMEGLLLRRDDQPYRQVMAERVAFLLAQDLEQRKKIVRDVKKIYDVRSDIAHEGLSRDLEEQLGPAWFYSAHTILRFLQLMSEKAWRSHDDFICWLDDLKFA